MPSSAPRAPIRPVPAVPRLVAVLDGLTALLALVAASTLATGGFRADVLGVRVSTTSWWRVALVALVVLIARHGWQRTPSMVARGREAFERWRRDPLTRATWPIVVTTRLGVLVLGLLAVHAIGYPQGRAPIRVAVGEVANLPARFDAGWYLTIATRGYEYLPNRFDRQQNLVFFPAFPTLMAWVSLLFARQVVWSGAIVSMAAFAWAMRYFFRLARELMDEPRAVVAVALLAVYPFAVFFSAPYTEGLFLLAMLGAWWHLRRDERWAGFAWGFVAGLTRPNGWWRRSGNMAGSSVRRTAGSAWSTGWWSRPRPASACWRIRPTSTTSPAIRSCGSGSRRPGGARTSAWRRSSPASGARSASRASMATPPATCRTS